MTFEKITATPAVSPNLNTNRGTAMNRKHSTIMSLEDHRAAARELNVVLTGVMRVAGATQRKEMVPERVFTRLRRIRRAVDKIRIEMQAVLVRTLPNDSGTATCWREPDLSLASAPTPPKSVSVMTPAAHIAAARDMGEARRVVLRFLDLVSDRKHLPVRILDIGLRIDMFIELIRHDMHYVRYATLPRPDGTADYWVGQFNYFDGDEAGGKARSQLSGDEHRRRS
jgi:hypothetical protein